MHVNGVFMFVSQSKCNPFDNQRDNEEIGNVKLRSIQSIYDDWIGLNLTSSHYRSNFFPIRNEMYIFNAIEDPCAIWVTSGWQVNDQWITSECISRHDDFKSLPGWVRVRVRVYTLSYRQPSSWWNGDSKPRFPFRSTRDLNPETLWWQKWKPRPYVIQTSAAKTAISNRRPSNV